MTSSKIRNHYIVANVQKEREREREREGQREREIHRYIDKYTYLYIILCYIVFYYIVQRKTIHILIKTFRLLPLLIHVKILIF